LDRIVPPLFSQDVREPRLARVVLLVEPMCGFANSNWVFSLTMVLTFAGLVVTSVILLVRSFDRNAEKSDDEKS